TCERGMKTGAHSTHSPGQRTRFVAARQAGNTPRILGSWPPWVSPILGRSGGPRSRTAVDEAALRRLAILRTTKGPHSVLTGPATTLRPRVSRGAPRTAAGDALRLTCWS